MIIGMGGRAVRRYILQAVDLARIGQREEALRLLRTIVRHDPGQIVAWKWLSYLSPDPREALAAARQVLRLNPSDEWAQQSLPALIEKARRAQAVRAAPRRRRSFALPVALMLILLLIWAGVAGLWAMGRPSSAAVPASSAVATYSSALSALLTSEAPLEPADEGAQRVVTTITIKTYRFEAGSLPAMMQALYTLGPKLETGSDPAIAATSYSMEVDWEAAEAPHECRLDRATVRLNITYTYPQWIPTGSPQPALYEEWERFLTYVVAHEEHHGAIALECAYELADQTEALGAFSTCADLQSAINDLIKSAYAACEVRQDAFDEAEGKVSFPLPR